MKLYEITAKSGSKYTYYLAPSGHAAIGSSHASGVWGNTSIDDLVARDMHSTPGWKLTESGGVSGSSIQFNGASRRKQVVGRIMDILSANKVDLDASYDLHLTRYDVVLELMFEDKLYRYPSSNPIDYDTGIILAFEWLKDILGVNQGQVKIINDIFTRVTS